MPVQHPLPRSTPEAQGLSSTAIADFLDAVEGQEIELHSIMLLRHGHVVAEGWWSPYTSDRIHQLYSLSKSFTSTAIGLAIHEGLLSVDDPVLSFFPEKRPSSAHQHLEDMRVHHLLSMSTGHLEDALHPAIEAAGDDWVAGFFLVPPDQPPGSVFAYNNAATFMLSAILQKLTGIRLAEYLQPRLFEPLGILQTYWYQNPQGINPGFSGLHITTESIAKLGQLYLQNGKWAGEQLISKAWVEMATSKHIDTPSKPEGQEPDWEQGYGYQFWQTRYNSYRADGAFGQFCLVMPDQDVVLATTAGNDNMQVILDLVWEYLLPSMQEVNLGQDVAAHNALVSQLAVLDIQPARAESSSLMAATVSGNTYDFQADPNASGTQFVNLHFNQDHAILAVKDDGGEHRVRCGYNQWFSSTTTFLDDEEVPVVSSGAWTSPVVFSIQIRYLQTPHCLTLDFHFEGITLLVGGHWNVMFDSTEMPTIMGRLKL